MMSDEYTLASNFQREADDPRAAAEYEYRMARVRAADDERDVVNEWCPVHGSYAQPGAPWSPACPTCTYGGS